MSLASATVKVGATAISPTGGTDENLVSISDTTGRREMYYGSGSFLDRKYILFTTNEPVRSASAPNGWTQQRCNIVIKHPKVLVNENTTINTFRAEFACDVETSAAEKLELLLVAAQVLGMSDFVEFWQNQTVA